MHQRTETKQSTIQNKMADKEKILANLQYLNLPLTRHLVLQSYLGDHTMLTQMIKCLLNHTVVLYHISFATFICILSTELFHKDRRCDV